jgi:hypothetical protein
MAHGNITRASEMLPLVGKIAEIAVGEMRVTVKIVDSRERWGKVDALVTPLKGSGQAWKSTDSLINVRKGK